MNAFTTLLPMLALSAFMPAMQVRDSTPPPASTHPEMQQPDKPSARTVITKKHLKTKTQPAPKCTFGAAPAGPRCGGHAAGRDIKNREPIAAAKAMGTGIGRAGKKVGKGTKSAVVGTKDKVSGDQDNSDKYSSGPLK